MYSFAVIGAGAVAQTRYVPALVDHPDVSLDWVVDVDEERARRVASEADAAHATDHAAVLEGVDAAVLATPPKHHEPIARDCIEAGVHLLTEKPVAMSSQEARALTEASARENVHYAISRQYREAPACRLLRSLVDSGAIGEIETLRARFGDETDWEFASTYRLDEQRAGGGVLTDKGPHILDVVRWILGEDLRVDGYADDSYGGLEANAELSFSVPGTGTTGKLEMSASRDVTNRIEITGTRGRMVAEPAETELTLRTGGDEETLVTTTEPDPPTTSTERMARQVGRFVDSLDSPDVSYVPASTGVGVLELVEACYATREPLENPWDRVTASGGADGDTVLVTGAAGFIGGRVTHRIALGADAAVVPLVHTISGGGTMRTGRLPVDIEQGSVLDRERMEELLAGCTAVVHCAHGGREVTVDGTRTLLAAAEAQDVDSFVHMSSAVVHGHDAEGTITEKTPLAPDTDYAERKAAAEAVIRDWDGALEPTVFRPCIVYGPHSPWVSKPLEQLADGAVLAGGGAGHLNQVHVDNLVDALLAAVGEPDAAGETFLVADDEPVTWSEYYRALGELLDDHPPIQAISRPELAVYRRTRYIRDSVVPPARLLGRVLTAPSTLQLAAEELERTPWVAAMYRRLPGSVQDQILDRLDAPGTGEAAGDTVDIAYRYPPENQAKMQATRGRITTEKLRSTLDWEPRVSFERGLAVVGEWARYEGLAGDAGIPSAEGDGTRPGRNTPADGTGEEVATE